MWRSPASRLARNSCANPNPQIAIRSGDEDAGHRRSPSLSRMRLPRPAVHPTMISLCGPPAGYAPVRHIGEDACMGDDFDYWRSAGRHPPCLHRRPLRPAALPHCRPRHGAAHAARMLPPKPKLRAGPMARSSPKWRATDSPLPPIHRGSASPIGHAVGAGDRRLRGGHG